MRKVFSTFYWKLARIITFLLLGLAIIKLAVTVHYSISFYGTVESEPFKSLAAAVQESYVVGVVALCLVVMICAAGIIDLLSFFFITKRFRAITKVVERFAKGDLSQRIEVRSDDEIGRLAKSFNTMADTIVAQLESVDKADKLRQELVANVAHDLGSPLTSIQGYLETILMKDNTLENQTRKEYLEIILINTRSLIKLVNELFDLSKLDSELSKPKLEAFSLESLAQETIKQFRSEADKKNLALELEAGQKLPQVMADRSMITRVLNNLIENAIAYTPQNGNIFVSAKQNGDLVTIEVVDTGIGIPEQDLPYIFERFYRVDKDRSRSSGGAGLGLAIAKKIVEAHGQKLTAQSRSNQGTKMQFELAIAPKS